MKKLLDSWIFRVVFITITLVIAGGIVYATTPKDDLSSTNGIFKAITRRAQSEIPGVYAAEKNDWTAQMTDGFTVAVPGEAFKLNSQAGNSVSYTFGDSTSMPAYSANQTSTDTLQDITQIMPIIEDIMKQAGFGQSQAGIGTQFTKNDTDCFVPTPEYGALTLSCIDAQQRLELASSAKPFVTAYLAKNTVEALDVAIGPLIIKNSSHDSHVYKASKTDGYTIAEALLNISDVKYLALFYQKDGGNWNFVSQATDEYGFRCGEFESDPDARKAFYDQVCLGADGHVRLDTDNRALQ